VHRWLITAVLSLAACEGRKVEVQVVIPGPDSVDAPVANLALVALPYDRDSILATFEARSPRPADVTRALDSLFRRFSGPFATFADAAYRVEKLEQSLARLKARLDSLPRTAPAYAELFGRFGAATDSLAEARRERDRAQQDLARVRTAVTPRMDQLRERMSAWKDSTYQGYDTLTQRLNRAIGREPVSDSTGGDGRARLDLPGGRWWIYARSWDAWDPNSEWYWNVPVTGNRVVLDRNSGRRRPRY
jgi:hypothetical protein